MDILNPVDARVLGCLIEKELNTPDQYPLTLNSLTLACNQKSSRDPVMALEETDVVRALDHLRALHIAGERLVAGSRVPKYEHKIGAAWNLQPREVAVLSVLLLRGPQTTGQIRSRSGRSHSFSSLDEVVESIQELRSREDGPLVMQLPRLAGHKDNRFMHLLSGQPDMESIQASLAPEPATLQVRAESEAVAQLQERVSSLEIQVAELQTAFDAFRNQFE